MDRRNCRDECKCNFYLKNMVKFLCDDLFMLFMLFTIFFLGGGGEGPPFPPGYAPVIICYTENHL